MIRFDNGGILVEKASELPSLDFDDLYLDCETSSGDSKKGSLTPWHDCNICGVAITGDDCPNAWYIPKRLLTREWLLAIYMRSKRWINHNPKYDAHVLMNELDFPFYHGVMIDTITQAKLLDADRTFKGGYGLEVLSKDWLDRDPSKYKQAMWPYLEGVKNKDYGLVPDDLMGEYACQDVFDARDIHKYIVRRLPEECKKVSETEIKLTKTLLASERRGMRIDVTRIKIAKLKALMRMNEILEELKETLGYPMNPKSNVDCEDLFLNRYGMPVLARTAINLATGGGGNPSFGKDTLLEYLGMVDVPTDLLNLVIEFRHYSQLNSLFWDSWLGKEVYGYLHPDYNQAVRSSRMSCKTPNAQQLSKDAKMEIFPRPGYVFVSMDYSQIEYRMIAHYTKNKKAIKAYNEDPTTDYHNFVAGLVGCDRQPAKTINFGVAFNMGVAKLLIRLKADKTLAGEGLSSAQMEARAEEILEKYFIENPDLKSTRRDMERVAKRRGYVRNKYGRHLHLPGEQAWLAFNRIMQATAADVMKECANSVSPVYNEWVRSRDIHLVAFVHDDCVFEVPEGGVDEAIPYLKDKLETQSVSFSIPITVSVSVSKGSWGECEEIKI